MSDNIRIPSTVSIPDPLKMNSEQKGGGKKARKSDMERQEADIPAEPDAEIADEIEQHQLDIRI